MLKQFEQMDCCCIFCPYFRPQYLPSSSISSGGVSVILSRFAKAQFPCIVSLCESSTQTPALRKATSDGIIPPQEQNYNSEWQWTEKELGLLQDLDNE